jgi:hypothetical protein
MDVVWWCIEGEYTVSDYIQMGDTDEEGKEERMRE